MQSLKNHTVVFKTTTGGVKIAHNIPAHSLEQAKEIVKRQIKVRNPFGNVWQGKQENNNFNQ
jgi:hypothetical protein